MTSSRTPELVYHRGELLAEMFLTDLGAKIVSRSPFDSVDYLAFFESERKGFHVIAIEVKARELPIPAEFPITSKLVARAAESNIPTLLLVVDVKQNKFGYAWLDEFGRHPTCNFDRNMIRVPLLDAEQHREEILERVMSTSAAIT